MKFLYVTFLLLGVVYAKEIQNWDEYKSFYNKHYDSKDEDKDRMKIQKVNRLKTIQHNILFKKGKKSYYLRLNQFSDMEAKEADSILNGFGKGPRHLQGPSKGSRWDPPVGASIPSSKDWREEGAVTDVKNQSYCASCWAFSAVGSLEGQVFLKTGNLVSLSEQNLLDCMGNSSGCFGGLMNSAFEYIKENGGINTRESYPEKHYQQSCRYDENDSGGTCQGYANLSPGNEDDLLKAVATIGPISVAIDGSHSSFINYGGGIYDESACSSTYVNRGVLVVGYGSENGTDYWIVKNSWGENWGEDGYIRMSRNKKNQCGIAQKASFPILNGN